MRYILAVVLILLVRPAMAASGDVSVVLRYEVFSHHLPVMRMDATLNMSSAGYRVSVTYHTIGIASVLYHGREQDSVVGSWDGSGVAPRRYLAEGTWRGRQRETEVVYNNRVPAVVIADPPIAEEREPIAADLLPRTIDTLSALVRLLRQVQSTGTCDSSLHTFDGRRLSRIVARTAGTTTLETVDLSPFSGQTLRCDFTGQMVAGFVLDHPKNEPPPPYHGSAWLARLSPDGPVLPVRLSFGTAWLGDVTMYLEQAADQATPVAEADSPLVQ